MKKIMIALVCLVLICGCTSKLKNGEESVVKFEDGGVSAEELYKELKTNYGTQAMIDLLDTKLLSKEYKKDEEETKYINNSIKVYKSQWKDDFDTNIKTYFGADSEKELKEIIRLSYRRNLWKTDYAQSEVNDKQIEDYYNGYVVGDITASHILITSTATSTMSDKEKQEAEAKALETAKEVITKLNEGAKFEDLAKEYSKDAGTKDKGGELDKFNDRTNFDENFLKEAISLEVGKYTTTPVKSEHGYHIIYKTKQDKKPELNDIKDSIIAKVAQDNIKADSNFTTKALLALREKYGVKVKDTELKKAYNKVYGL